MGCSCTKSQFLIQKNNQETSIPKPLSQEMQWMDQDSDTQRKSLFSQKIYHVEKNTTLNWNQNLKKLQDTFIKNSKKDDILGFDLWSYVLNKFQKMCFKHEDKISFIKLIKLYSQVNCEGITKIKQQGQNYNEFNYCGLIGSKLLKMNNKITYQNQINQEILDLLANTDIFNKNIDQITQKVNQLFFKNSDSFALLSLYMLVNVKIQLLSKSFEEVNQGFKKNIVYLETKYPPSKVIEHFGKQTQIFDNFVKDNYKPEIIEFFNKCISKKQQIKKFILKKVKGAEKDYQLFRDLVEKICQKNGHGLKTNLKVKKINGQYSLPAIQRAIQKLTQDLRLKYKSIFQENKKKIIQRFTSQKYNQSDFLELVSTQINQVNKINEEILERQQRMIFNVKDLVRGKCVFQKIEELIETAQQLIQHIRQQGHKIIDLKNRFKQKNSSKSTNDLVLIIGLPNSIAQFQLALKLNCHANEFNHKLYELQRSSTYSLITNLFINNQRWCSTLFSDLTNFICQKDQMKIKCHLQNKQDKGLCSFFNGLSDILNLINKNGRQFQQQKKKQQIFNQNRFKYQQLFKRYLIENNVNWINRKQNQDKDFLIQQEIKDLINLISNKQKNSYINFDERIKYVKLNQINFFYNFMDYQKVEQLVNMNQNIDNETTRFTSYIMGSIYYQKGNYSQSLKYYKKCLDIDIEMKNLQSLDSGRNLQKIGIIYIQLGNINQAKKYFKSSLQIFFKLKGEYSIDFADILNNIGRIFQSKGNYPEAQKYFLRSLNITIQILGKQSLKTAYCLQDIGSIYISEGNYPEAKKNLYKSLEIKSKLKGQQSLEVASTLNTLGYLFSCQGNDEEALKNLYKSLKIKTKLKSQNLSDVAITLNSIGLTYKRQLNYQEALKNYSKSLQIRIRVFGKQSLPVAESLKNIGDVYHDQSDYLQAIRNYTRSVQIYAKIKGGSSIQVAIVMDNLADVQTALGHFTKALKIYQKCLETKKRITGEDSINIVGTLNRIGKVYSIQGKYLKALQYYVKCLQITTKIKGKLSLDVASILNNIGIDQLNLGNYPQAIKNLNNCIEIWTKLKGQQFQKIACPWYHLSLVYQSMQFYQKSLICCKKSLNIWMKNLNQNDEQINLATNQIKKLENKISQIKK